MSRENMPQHHSILACWGLILGILCMLGASSGSSLAVYAQQAATGTPTPNRPPAKPEWDSEALKMAAKAAQQLDQKSINSALNLGLQSLTHYQDGIYHPESGSVLASSVALAPVAPLVLTQTEDESLARVEWNPDGTRLLSVGRNGSSVWVWDAITGRHQLTLSPEDGSWIWDAEWDPSGKRIVTSAADVRVWDAITGQQLLMEPLTAAVARFSPSGKQIWAWDRSTLQIFDTSTGKVLLTLGDQKGIWSSAKWNRDESEILFPNPDAVGVWDIASGKQRLSLAHPCTLGDASWSQDDSRILTRCVDNDARLWDATSGKLLLTLPYPNPNGATFNKTGTRILTSATQGDPVQVWDATSGDPVLTLPQSREDSFEVESSWNADETMILTWCHCRKAHVWNATNGKLLMTVNYDVGLQSADWDPMGRRILTNSGGSARVWDAATGKMVLILDNPDLVAAWNADGSRIVTWNWTIDNMMRVWDTTSVNGAEPTLFHAGAVKGTRWSKDEKCILTWAYGNTAQVWDASTGKVLLTLTHNATVRGAIWNKNENKILTWADDKTAQVWDAFTGKSLLTLTHGTSVEGAIWNKDEHKLLTWAGDKTVQVWDAFSGKSLLTLTHKANVEGATWNNDESQILTWADDQAAHVWDAVTGKLLFNLPHKSPLEGAAWNAQSTRILTWSLDHTAQLWNADTGEVLLTLNHDDYVMGAVWNRTETQILTWSFDHTARVWDATSGKLLMTLTHSNLVWGAQWNKDETQLLTWSDDQTARVWDANSGQLLLTLSHRDAVSGAQWSVDQTRILTWSDDHTVQVWDAAKGKRLFTLAHDDKINGAQWSMDGTHILSWSDDQTARVWLVNIPKLIVAAKARLVPSPAQ